MALYNLDCILVTNLPNAWERVRTWALGMGKYFNSFFISSILNKKGQFENFCHRMVHRTEHTYVWEDALISLLHIGGTFISLYCSTPDLKNTNLNFVTKISSNITVVHMNFSLNPKKYSFLLCFSYVNYNF